VADRVDEPITVTVRFFAAARAAAGVQEEKLSIPAPATVADVLASVVARHGDGLGDVLRRCSYLLNETAVRGAGTTVPAAAVLDVLPPFAGG